MNANASSRARVIHRLPGRLRVHLPRWSGQDCRQLEEGFCLVPGVYSVHAEPLTGNVLIRFDSQTLTETDLLAAADAWSPSFGQASGREASAAPDRLSAALGGVVRHILVDALVGMVVSAEPFGLPLGTLRVVQLGLEVFTWGSALRRWEPVALSAE
jgi:hypothetical protein